MVRGTSKIELRTVWIEHGYSFTSLLTALRCEGDAYKLVSGRLSAEHGCYMLHVTSQLILTDTDFLADALTFGGLRKFATRSSLFAQPRAERRAPAPSGNLQLPCLSYP
jgi:hypothetical protein